MSVSPARPGIDVCADDLIRLRHQARNLQLGARRPVASVLAGVHTSQFRGRGVDFLESRHYQPGDDIRNIDWRVTARTGKPHTKVFQEERERPVIVLLDLNPTMFFGSRVRLKVVQAANLAALIAWAAVRRGDRIGGLISAGDAHQEVRPAGGRRGAMRWIGSIDTAARQYAPQRFTAKRVSLSEPIKRLRRVARPGSLVFLASDLQGIDADCERHLARLRMHCDVVALEVLDALELAPPPPALYAVSNGQRAAEIDLRSSAQQRSYLVDLQQTREQVHSMLVRYDITTVRCRTDQNPFNVLNRALGGSSR